MKHLYEYAESENYQHGGLEGVSAKDILMHLHPPVLEAVIKDFDVQCDESDEFKNLNLDKIKSLISFFLKYFQASKFIDSMAKKYSIK